MIFQRYATRAATEIPYSKVNGGLLQATTANHEGGAFSDSAVWRFLIKELLQGHMQYLYDANGKKYLDMFAGIVTVSVGHCHP